MKDNSEDTKILVICTGNTCRSQMAEGIIKNIDKSFRVFSAGSKPEKIVNPFAVRVMNEIGIDISNNKPKSVDLFTGENFDYVFTVCDNAKEICPVFTGNVKNRIHSGFDDPAYASGSDEEIMNVYRNVRDKLKVYFTGFFNNTGNN